MKVFLILILTVIAGCSSSPQRDGMLLRAVSHIPSSTKRHLAGSSRDQIQQMVIEGAQKFSLDELYKLNSLKLKILEGSDVGCRAIFDNSIDPNSREIAFNSLNDDEYDDYAKLYARAVSLGTSYDIKPFIKPTQEEFEDSIGIVIKENEKQTAKLTSPLIKGDELQEKCTLFKTVMRYADQKRDYTSENIVKFMAII